MKLPVAESMAGFVKRSDYFGNPLKTMLFDVVADPAQNTELDDEAIERRLKQEIKRLMEDNDAPQEQFARMGLDSL